MERVFSGQEKNDLKSSVLATAAFLELHSSEQSTIVTLEQLLASPLFHQFQNQLGYQFKSKELYLEALTHRSFAHELTTSISPLKDNERLEFIGDSVLNLLVSLELAERFPGLQEGPLSKLRSALVNQDSLARLAQFIGLGSMLLVGRGELQQQGMFRASLLADAFEAIFAAVYLDSDFATVKHCFRALIKRYEETETPWADLQLLENFDAKSKLQELTLKLFKKLPEYQAKNLEQNSLFEMNLIIEEWQFGPVVSNSKRKAERELAIIALNYLSTQFKHKISPSEENISC